MIARVLVGKTHARACVILCALLIPAVFLRETCTTGIKKPKPVVTEKGVGVLPPTMGGFAKSKEEEELEKADAEAAAAQTGTPSGDADAALGDFLSSV